MFGKREKQVDKVNLPIEKSPAQSNSANPDYNHSLQEFLSEDSLLVPKKAEYTSLKDFDQRIHVLKFDGLTAKKAENRKCRKKRRNCCRWLHYNFCHYIPY